MKIGIGIKQNEKQPFCNGLNIRMLQTIYREIYRDSPIFYALFFRPLLHQSIENKNVSPLTNHKNTQKGTVKGGFDRKNLFQQAEQGFDKLFAYNRPLTESFEYYNTMKNGTIADQLKIQEKQISNERKMNTRMQTTMYANKQEEMTGNLFVNKQENNISSNNENNQIANQEDKKENLQSFNLPDLGLSSALGLLTPDVNSQEEEQHPVKKKIKKKPKRGLRN